MLRKWLQTLKKYLTNTPVYTLRKRCKGMSAVWWYGNPARDMTVIGITGTDGKTTTSRLIHHLLTSAGYTTAFFGTTGARIGTTPATGVQKMTSYDPRDLQRLLRQAKRAGCTHLVVEVSSHALIQQRFLWVRFTAAGITNIAPEHLDYHKTMEAYQEAKKLLFTQLIRSRWSLLVFPRDQPIGRQRYEQLAADAHAHGVATIITATEQQGEKLAAQLTPPPTGSCSATDIEEHVDHTTYTRQEPNLPIRQILPGRFNVHNALLAIAIVSWLGVDPQQIAQAMQTAQPEEGRQRMVEHHGTKYIIDFAHTPQGLEAVLSYMQRVITQQGNNKVRCLFGAPGERDPYKRPDMARVVERYADEIVVTDDDAAGEDRMQIIRDIHQWFADHEAPHIHTIPDRKEAIERLVGQVQPGDIVLLAGKWHERVLVTNAGKIPRSDQDVLARAVAKVTSV